MQVEIALASEDAKAYHGTTLQSLIGIVMTDTLKLSQVAGKQSEQAFAKHPFFFSVRRTPSSAKELFYNVTLEFKASRLNSIMRREAVNYWGQETIHQGGNEQEDRYYHKKSSIRPVMRLLSAVYIDVENVRSQKELRAAMIQLRKNKVKVYAIPTHREYKKLDVRHAIPLKNISIAKPESAFKTYEGQADDQMMKGLRYKRDQYTDTKFIWTCLQAGRAPADAHKNYKHLTDRLGYTWYGHDLESQVGNILHNGSHSKVEREYTAKIQAYMRKHGLDVAGLANKVREIIQGTSHEK